MSAEDRRRLSTEMMARIDQVVSGHELQRSSEGGMPVDDGPLEFGASSANRWDVRPPPPMDAAPSNDPPRYPPPLTPRLSVHHLDGNPRNNAVENLAVVDPRENRFQGYTADLVIFDEVTSDDDWMSLHRPDPFLEPALDRARRELQRRVEARLLDSLGLPEGVAFAPVTPDPPLPWTIDEDGHFYGYAAEGAPTAPVAPDTASYEPFRMAAFARAMFEATIPITEAVRAVRHRIQRHQGDTP